MTALKSNSLPRPRPLHLSWEMISSQAQDCARLRVCQCPGAQMFFVLRKGCETPLALVWVGCEIAKTGSLLLPACNVLRSDFAACDSSCTPLHGRGFLSGRGFRFLSSPILKRGQKQASLLLSFLPALVYVPRSVLLAPAWAACIRTLILVFSL